MFEFEEHSPKRPCQELHPRRPILSEGKNFSRDQTIPNVLHLRHPIRIHPHRAIELEFRRTKTMIDGTLLLIR
jgi:hypothetical protein